MNATTGGEETKEVHSIPKNKAENRLNQTFHYSKKSSATDKKSESMLSHEQEDASERENRLKSVRLADSFNLMDQGKKLIDQGRRGVLLARDVFDEDLHEKESNFSNY